jgi:CDGSH-type Zn-finger protein/uncharacterized Fe-S cluster protein YjdI
VSTLVSKEEAMDEEEYRGKAVAIRFDGSKCIHSRNCVLTLPNVFLANVEGPWIQPDNADAEAVAALARSCPSGAIAYERLDGGPDESAPLVNVIRVLENGPLAICGDVRLDENAPAFRVTLCRCGDSRNKPFCDGSHKTVGFAATGEPPSAAEVGSLESRDGALEVNPSSNGPLLLKGNVEICAGTGRTIDRKTSCALCRCGRSKNKPYCDGTHTEIGFRS